MRLLADGRSHSGEALALQFGVTRAAVWKQVAKLGQWGLDVDAAPGVGYRLRAPLDLLDPEALRNALPPRAASSIERIDAFVEIDSTNRYLLEGPRPAPGTLAVCVAEYQNAGRGRRGRRWTAPLGAGLTLSAGWQFAETPPELSALTLAIGVVARRVLAASAGVDVSLKWPNDLVFDGRKLGGILVELIAEAQGGCYVVAGVGINVAVPRERLAELSDLGGGAVDLAEATGGRPPRRTALAAALTAALAGLFETYAATGFAPYRGEFARADYLAGRHIRIDDAAGAETGTARGVDADGALLVESAAGGLRRVISGDVTVRPEP